MPNGEDKHPFMSKHLILVLALLFALLATEGLIFWMLKDNTTNLKDIMALTFGTFGTWIGAGAAYFFGRENMRTATDSLLRMRERTPTEILANTTLRDMNPRPVLAKFKETDEISGLITWLKENKKRFFTVVVDNEGKFKYALNEEAIYLFALDKLEQDKPLKRGEIYTKKVYEVIEHFKKAEAKKDIKSLIQAAISMSEGSSVLSASEKMEQERVHVTIVVDAQDRPTGYITTEDIRRLMLSVSR